MEQEKLKSLRIKIPVSLREAIYFLKKNNGNIEACEKEFHDNNINEICKITDCEIEKARRYYEKFNFNKEKAIIGINNEQRILTIGNSKIGKNAIGFILWFEDENGEHYKTKKRNDIFIPTEYFDHIKEEFESNCSENFDVTFNNYFNKTEIKLIVEALEKKKNDNPNQNKFLRDLTEWINDNLKYSEILVVCGNL